MGMAELTIKGKRKIVLCLNVRPHSSYFENTIAHRNKVCEAVSVVDKTVGSGRRPACGFEAL